ncbi:PAQR family membrane homeostasis protein TrhA [Flagellimonas pacifica]|uniref:Hemolysin III n=1 Tax=Flagellimonas pacifica TaxID=1247520 RepID=A0A285MS57_9FLAO|nr:hemolysin III family protein [Allomuricauda parva]SNY99367.1 hemolysin III [Allomuricauda parva]
MTSNPKSTLIEERLNAYSHALGVAISIIGFVLIFQQDMTGVPFLYGSILIYSSSLVFLFSASTIYHAVQNPKLKKKLRILDHIGIYYLIAGTYTPVCLTILLGSKGWLLFYCVWGIAFLGTFLKLFFTGKFEVFSLVLYGLMGWLVVIDYPFLVQNITLKGLSYLALGGAFYTIGILFYAIKRIPYNHLIWHIFVLGGAISHWVLIFSEIID